MQREFPVNVQAVIWQRDQSISSGLEVRVDRSKAGKTRYTILQPLRLQGVESIDNLERYQVYWPDQNELIDQESPQKDQCDANFRMSLAERNYTIRLGGSRVIAHRRALCVIATPKSRVLDIRRYFIDEQTGYPLMLETISSLRRKTIHFETKVVEFPDSLNEDSFRFVTLRSAHTYTYERPKNLTVQSAKKEIGFEPLLPSLFPLGFKLQQIQLNKTPEWTSLALRLTDGLVRATVYEWRPGAKARELESLEDSSATDFRGIRLMVVSDLRPSLRKLLLEAFIERAESESSTLGIFGAIDPNEKQWVPGLEPQDVFQALAKVESIEGAVSKPSKDPE